MDDRVVLRPVREDDLAVLERLTNSPEGAGPHEWHGWTDPHLWRHRWTENGLLGSAGGTLLVARGPDVPGPDVPGPDVPGPDVLGLVTWRQVITGQSSYCWELGIIMAPEARGRGLGTLAQRLVVRYLFAHTQVNRIQAGTEITNIAEQRALEKAGFTREGILRGSGFRDGRWRDGVLYSVLRDEVDPEADLDAGP